jgi:sugar/nucleoside kinase (ribokinase family)
MRTGIISGGNWIVDNVKVIDIWPPQDALASIHSEKRGSGGSPYNILRDLAKLGAKYPLEAIGLVGDDDLGRWVEADCKAHRIDTRQLKPAKGSSTSYTDVMTVQSTGRRTFFHQRGANAKLAPEHFDFGTTQAKMFHLGYLLLLDALDAPGKDGKPRSCEVLAAARTAGLSTSIDLVSEASDRFAKVVMPTLPLIDTLLVNDFEATRVTGIPVRKGDALDPAGVVAAAQAMIKAGVNQWVVMHFPEGAYACDRSGKGIWQAGLRISNDLIKGAAGAGDAFGAGVLHGIHEQWPMDKSLLLGVSVAATCLFDATCSESIRPIDDCFALAKESGFQKLPV